MNLKTLANTPNWEWPPTAGPSIIRVLTDQKSSTADRVLAARLAGDGGLIDDKLADLLLSLVESGDQPEELRGAAAISLGPTLELADLDDLDEDLQSGQLSPFGFRRIKKRLGEIFNRSEVPTGVRRKVLEAAVRATEGWHKAAIKTAYASPEREWRVTAVFCMQYVKGFNQEILEALESQDPDIHYWAVCAAGNWEIKAAWGRIAPLATDRSRDKALRLAAIEAIATIRPKKAREILGQLTDARDQDIASAAFEALALAGASDFF